MNQCIEQYSAGITARETRKLYDVIFGQQLSF